MIGLPPRAGVTSTPPRDGRTSWTRACDESAWPGSAVVAPLLVHERYVARSLREPPGDVPYTPDDVALAEDLAGACSAALESARLYDVASIARAAAETAQRDAEGANQAKSRFLSMMSHDLRTPLTAIGGYAELLDLGVRGPVNEAQHKDLTRIKASQEHLLKLINEILSFARLEAGKVQYEMAGSAIDRRSRVENFVIPQASDKRLQYRYEPSVESEVRPPARGAPIGGRSAGTINLLTTPSNSRNRAGRSR